MNRKSRTIMMLAAFLMSNPAWSAAGAAKLCDSEWQHTLPVNMERAGMLRINDQTLVVMADEKRGVLGMQSKSKSFKHYQKPILIDKNSRGICHGKVDGFKQSTIKM